METFVIRVWVPAGEGDGGSSQLHGFVEHVRLGERRAFAGGGQLLSFIESAVATPARIDEAQEPDD